MKTKSDKTINISTPKGKSHSVYDETSQKRGKKRGGGCGCGGGVNVTTSKSKNEN
jgi:hypothetical protein